MKVLLSTRSVDEAPVIAVLQPKEPFNHVRAFAAALQPDPWSPAPKKLVVEAMVAKKEVEVALEVVLFAMVTFWKLD